MTYSEIVISVFIIALVLFAMWRVGQMNPIGTGKLERRLNVLEQKVADQGVRMDGIERSILTIADDVSTMGKEVGAMRVELAGDRGLTERTWSAVDRLQNYFIEDAFDKRRRLER